MTRQSIGAVVLAFALAVCGNARSAEKLALAGGTVINPAEGKVIEDALVVTRGETIEFVGRTTEKARDAGARRIDCRGKFILPGYIDTHVHFFQSGGLFTRPDAVDLTSVRSYAEERAWIERNLRDIFTRYLRCGITSVVDVGGPLWNFRVREISRGASAPRVAIAGPLISSVARPQLVLNDDPPIVKIDSPEQGVELVRRLAEEKPDYVKIWYVVSPESPVEKFRPIAEAVIKESHRLKLRVAVHATELEAARVAVQAGAELLVHSVNDQPVDEAFVRLMKERGTMLTPTLVVFERYGRTFANRLNLTAEEQRWGNPEVIATLDVTKLPGFSPSPQSSPPGRGGREAPGEGQPALPDRIKTALADPDAVLGRIQKTYDVALENLKTLSDAGVTIATGTDAGNIGTIHGPSIFREFQLMREAGLTPLQILKCTTADAAKVFGGETGAKLGAVAPGKLADFVILNSNPLEDISRASDIHSVIKGGVVVHQTDLEKSE